MRIIEKPKDVRIGVRRDGAQDGFVWRIYVGEEEIMVRRIRFAGTLTPTTLQFETDRARKNLGRFLGWLQVHPNRIEIRNHIAYLFF